MPWIFSEVGKNYAERVLPSIGNEVLKGFYFPTSFRSAVLGFLSNSLLFLFLAVVAEYDADELVTQREAVSSEIREKLIRRAATYQIQLHDVSITNLEFRFFFLTVFSHCYSSFPSLFPFSHVSLLSSALSTLQRLKESKCSNRLPSARSSRSSKLDKSKWRLSSKWRERQRPAA